VAKVGGTTPAWRTAAAEIEAALREHQALLVLGEPGTGRFTLTAELYHVLHENGRSVALDAEDMNRGPDDVLALLLESDAQPTLYIMRGLERLTQATVERLLVSLDRAPKSQSQIYLAATAAWPSHQDDPYQALLHHFDTSVTVPPLRHRGADIAELANAMVTSLAPHRDVRLSRGAVRAILRYEWPGNARQLQEALASALSRRPVGAIDVTDLPAFCHSAPRSWLSHLDEVERDAIVEALHDHDGNRLAAAAALGLARSTLYRKLKHYGITR